MSEADDNDALLAEGRKQFEMCVEAEDENRRISRQDIEFAVEGNQWEAKFRKQREDDGRPCLTINKLPAFIRQVVNDARQNKPSIKVHPADSGADPETAEIFNGLIRNIEYTSNADVAYDTGDECAVRGGWGYWRITADYAYDDSFEMDLAIKRVANPLTIFGDPNSTEADSSDWDVAFVVDWINEAQWDRDWKGKAKVPFNSGDESAYAKDWVRDDGKEIQIAEWWSREKLDKEIVKVQDLRPDKNGAIYVYGKDQIESDEQLKALIGAGALKVIDQRVTKSCKVTQRFMSGAEILETKEWAGKYIPIIPVYGVEYVDSNGKRQFRGLIHDAIDAQRMLNYWRTTSTELVAMSPRVPFIGPVGAFATDPRWDSINNQSHPYVEYDGQIPPQRQPLDVGPAAGALQEALNASDDMKAIIGLYDASLGARSNETSGKAIMARQREGDVSTFHFSDNESRAIRHTGRVLIDLIPHFYNTARVVRVMGEDGKEEKVKINQEFQRPQMGPNGQPVQQPQPQMGPDGQPMQDPNGQPVMQMQPVYETVMHDLTTGKYDLTVSTGPSFTTRRQEAAEAMTEMIRAFPQSAPVIGPRLAKNLDFPEAEEIGDELKALTSGQVPPQVQKQIDEGKKLIETLTQENQKLKQDQSIDQAKLQADIQMANVEAENKVKIAMIDIEAEKQIAMAKLQSQQQIDTYKATLQAQANAMRPAPYSQPQA